MITSDKNSKQNAENLKSILRIFSQNSGDQACLFNLIVYTSEDRRTAYFDELVKMIRRQFPCRVIFITANLLVSDDQFQVQASSEKEEEGRRYLCDQIHIRASGEGIEQAYFLLYPLFVPDLPIYLIWGEDPTKEQTILPHLENFATRLIFDSETTEDLQQFSRDMLNRINSTATQMVDMNWARMNGWREVLAQVFDSPERVDQLSNANSIDFFYNNKRSELFNHPETQAIYLQAWLASRLKWDFLRGEKKNGSQIIYYKSHDRTRCVQLTAVSDEAFESEEILSVHVQGDHGYDCHAQRISLEQVKIQASNQFQCELPFILVMPTLRSGRSFMQEIFYQKMSDQYKGMLDMISLTRWS
ncbi:MAG: glucose-6-phosphate dehydrogenase assembly protein OpcA [Parachlamydiaceae bacterium]